LLDLREQGRGRRGFGVGVHHQHIAIKHENRRIAIRQSLRLGERREDAVGYFLDAKETGVRRLCLSPRPAGAKKRLLKDRRSRQNASKAVSKKIAASVPVMITSHVTLPDLPPSILRSSCDS